MSTLQLRHIVLRVRIRLLSMSKSEDPLTPPQCGAMVLFGITADRVVRVRVTDRLRVASVTSMTCEKFLHLSCP
eukprot:1393489-Amorphochlora_amoeboformis.AAC.1